MNRTPVTKPYLSWEQFVGLLAIGIVLAGGMTWGLYEYCWETARQLYATQHWVQIPCQIRVSRTRPARKGRRMIEVLYDYEFGGKTYHGDRYDLRRFPVARATAESAVRGFSEGIPNRCWVDPDEPSRAVLVRGGAGEVVFAAGVYTPLAILGYWVIWTALRTKLQQNAT